MSANAKTATIIASLAGMAYLATSAPSNAMEHGFYVGGFYGQLQRDANERAEEASFEAFAVDIYDSLGVATLSTDPSLDFRDRSYGFVGGYRILPNLAIEASYMELGELKYRSDDVVADNLGSFPITSSIRSDISGFGISALGIWPISYEWEVYGRAGFLLSSSEIIIRLRDEFGTLSGGDNQDSFDWLAGAGVSYTFLDVYTARAEFQRVFDAGHRDTGPVSDVDLLSISLLVTF
jgi:opacity protein-like surface antigen